MPKLPTVADSRRQTPTPQRGVHGYSTSSYERMNNEAAQALEDTGKQLAIMGESRQKKIDKDAILDAQERENQAQRAVLDLQYGDGEREGLFSRQGKNAMGVEKEFNQNWATIRTRALAGVDNPEAKRALQRSLGNMQISAISSVKRFKASEQRSYFSELSQNKGALARERAGLEWNNPKTFESSLAESEAAARNDAMSKGLSSEGQSLAIREARSATYSARIGAMINTDDPKALAAAAELYDHARTKGELTFADINKLDNAIDAILPKVQASKAFDEFRGPVRGKKDMIKFVMNDLEGGDQIVEDGNGRARWGINDAANPDVNLDIMTEGDAEKLYDDRYFKRIEKYDLSPEGQMIAFDAAVNHRAGFAEEMVEESGGDPEKMLLMRLQEYERLAHEDPDKYGKNLEGWRNRLKKLYGHLEGGASVASYQPLDLVKAEALASGMEEQTGTEFVKLVKNQNEAMLAQKTTEVKGIMDDAFTAMQANGGGYESLPNALRIRAHDAGIARSLAEYDGTTDDATVDYLYSLAPEDLKKADLNSPGIRLSLSPQDYDKWVKKQSQLDSSAMMVTQESRNKQINKMFSDLNISTKTKDGIKQKNRLNELLDLEIDAFSSQNSGRSPNPAEVQKMLDGLFIEGDYDVNGWWFGGGKDRAFDINAEDIPKKARKEIEADLRAEGFPVTDAMVIKRWLLGYSD